MSAQDSSRLIRHLLRRDHPSSPRPHLEGQRRAHAPVQAVARQSASIDPVIVHRLHRAIRDNGLGAPAVAPSVSEWSVFETDEESKAVVETAGGVRGESTSTAPAPSGKGAPAPSSSRMEPEPSEPQSAITEIESAIAATSKGLTHATNDAPPDLERVRSASARRMVELPLRVRLEKDLERGLGTRFDPGADEIFDQVWVKVQRRLGQPDGDEESQASSESIRLHSIQSMLVTSWSNDEGSSTVSLGLAARCSSTAPGRVCLVDADFQSQGLTLSAARQGQPGLSDLISETASLEDVLVKAEGGDYYFISAGTKPDSDALANDIRLQTVIRLLEDRFRYIFYDTSSLKRGVEAMRWGPFVVNTILVVRSGTTRKQTIAHAADQLQLHGMRLLGTVLNRRVNHIPEWLYPHV